MRRFFEYIQSEVEEEMEIIKNLCGTVRDMHERADIRNRKVHFSHVFKGEKVTVQERTRTLFELFDIDGDGKIDTQEWKEGFKLMEIEFDENSLNEILNHFSDENGQITPDQFNEMIHMVRLRFLKTMMGCPDHGLSLRDIFETIDMDSSGWISKKQWVSMCAVIFHVPHDVAIQMFEDIDIDKSDSVTYEEYVEAIFEYGYLKEHQSIQGVTQEEFCILGEKCEGLTTRDCIEAFELCDRDNNGSVDFHEIEEFVSTESNPTQKVILNEWRHMLMYSLSLTGYSLSFLNIFTDNAYSFIRNSAAFFIALGGFTFVSASFHLLTQVKSASPQSVEAMKHVLRRISKSEEIYSTSDDNPLPDTFSSDADASGLSTLVERVLNYGTFQRSNSGVASSATESLILPDAL